jgi:hypothetical protein
VPVAAVNDKSRWLVLPTLVLAAGAGQRREIAGYLVGDRERKASGRHSQCLD